VRPHFRGLSLLVDSPKRNSINGEWSRLRTKAISRTRGKLDRCFVAEDLGMITKEVETCVLLAMPGMKVIQFDLATRARTCICPTIHARHRGLHGTHDNDTTSAVERRKQG